MKKVKNISNNKKGVSVWYKMICVISCFLIVGGFGLSFLGTIGKIISLILILFGLFLFRFAKKYE